MPREVPVAQGFSPAFSICRVTLALGLALTAISAQESGAPQFRYERVSDTASGPQRLAIDLPLLLGSQPFTIAFRTGNRPALSRVEGPETTPVLSKPFVLRQAQGERRVEGRMTAGGGLGDLRLFDGAGREIPYLLVSPPPAYAWTRGRVLAIAPTKKTSGFEADFGEAVLTDRVRIEGLRPPFLKRVLLEGSGDRAHWTVLVAQGTLFHLPDERLEHTELAFVPGSYQYVRATWDDTSSAVMALPMDVSARVLSERDAPAPALAPAFTAERVGSEPGHSRYRILLLGPRLPIVSLEPKTDAPYVFRDATITESRLANSQLAPLPLGRGLLRRVVRDQLSASGLAIPIDAPTEPEVELTIDDGDNQPLDIREVTARFADLPWIYFESPGGPVLARWGDPRLRAPQYDLEAARASLAIGSVPEATWGDVRTLTPAVPSLPTPMPNTGPPIEVDRFRYSRDVPSGEAGLIAVHLDAAVLAHSTGVRTSFADVRIADANGRQVPYLVERRDARLVVVVTLEPRAAPASDRSAGKGTRTFYRVRLPFANLPPWSLALKTNATIFDRRVTLGVERPADAARRDPWMQVIAADRWVHADREKAAPELTLRGTDPGATDLVLVVDEGDNTPLPIASTRLLLPSYRLRLFRDSGAALRLVYGRDDIGPPSYDLALLAPSVLGVPAREVAASEEQPLAAARAALPLGSPRVFWSVLIAAVLVLLVLLVKLIKRGA